MAAFSGWRLAFKGTFPTNQLVQRIIRPQLQELTNPAPSWLSNKAWNEILALEALPIFQPFVSSFSKNVKAYKALFDSVDPHR